MINFYIKDTNFPKNYFLKYGKIFLYICKIFSKYCRYRTLVAILKSLNIFPDELVTRGSIRIQSIYVLHPNAEKYHSNLKVQGSAMDHGAMRKKMHVTKPLWELHSTVRS
jgi:hypothetical protein